MISERQLLWWYRHYNRCCFGGRLPKFALISFHGDKHESAHSFPSMILPVIRINRRLRAFPWAAHVALLHEMAHFKAMGHGRDFQREIDKLYRKGAYEGLL